MLRVLMLRVRVPLKSNLILVAKVSRLIRMLHFTIPNCKARLCALLKSIKLAEKGLPLTNTLAYLLAASAPLLMASLPSLV
jgi:hypothetical protein